MGTRTYTDLIKIPDYHGRLAYLSLHGVLGDLNQDVNRYLNQKFYRTPEWRNVRKTIIIRDNGFDMACKGVEIIGNPIIHHINPVTVDDVINRSPKLFDLNNLILVSKETHNLIHYGVAHPEEEQPVERTPGDTKLW